MLASRNQMNVMSRGFGGTHNGSMPAYGAVGEMETYNALGNLHLTMGKFTLAKAAIQRQLKLAQINEDEEVIEKSGLMLSNIYHNIFDATQVHI